MVSIKTDFRSSCCNAEVQRDAYAAWDYARQQWDLASVHPTHVCCKCGNACEPVELTIPVTVSG